MEFIRHSDGGVSELVEAPEDEIKRVYQAFRWWGIGTDHRGDSCNPQSLSGIPMVGYRNRERLHQQIPDEFIRHSDGGVSELLMLVIEGV